MNKKCKKSFDRNERSYYFMPMNKGRNTKQMILTAGLEMASELGLEAVTIGNLAKATQMSKSGLFAHFHSKENLQLAILDFAGDMFSHHVVAPALRASAGIARIHALVDNWVAWGDRLGGGCIFVSASSDFKDRPGRVRDFLLAQQKMWIDSLRKIAQSAIRAGDFKEDIDCDQFAFELYSLLLGFHLFHQLLHDRQIKTRQNKALSQLIQNYQ